MKVKTKEVISGSLLIAGTAIGAGMLGIPLTTAKAGFFPAIGITFLVWLYMLATGLLFLEVTLWMHKDANILSMSKKFLGKNGRILSGSVFVFLYYCLLVAYFAAGAPIFSTYIENLFSISLSGWQSYAFYALVFGSIVAVGIHFVDRVNYLLMSGLFLCYFALLGGGSAQVTLPRLAVADWSSLWFAAPILFSAFGYHNVIPSLTFHFKENARLMRLCIFWGTFIPFVIYALWQWLIIGAIPSDILVQTLEKGEPVTASLQSLTGHPWIQKVGLMFGFFAIITSLLGVAFSVVDFLGDGLKMRRTGMHRVVLCFLTFIPPCILTSLNPGVFILAISIAGGFGEAFLNGILPAWLVWKGRYQQNLTSSYSLFGGKGLLVFLFLIGLLVVGMEAFFLIK